MKDHFSGREIPDALELDEGGPSDALVWIPYHCGETGAELVRVPADAVYECAAPGRDAAPYVAETLEEMNESDWRADRPELERFLARLGAWLPEDLAQETDATIRERVLWVACCDLLEQSRPGAF